MHGNVLAQDAAVFALVYFRREDGRRGRAMRPRSLHMSLSTPLPTVGEIFQLDFDALNMATFAPIPYEYVPTPSRSRGAKARRKPVPEQSSILNDHSPAKQMGVALDAPWPPVGAAADENGSCMPGDQGIF